METEGNALCVEFPDFSCSLLQKLNQQRQRGQLCDIIVVIQGHQFRAHRAVLAASSPYFCDQVLLKNKARVVLPDVMRPCVLERLLHSCYTGTLLLQSGEVVAFLTAASFLQMWHVVDRCTELLEAGRGGSAGSLTHRSGAALGLCAGGGSDDRPSPGDSSYHSPGDDGSLGLDSSGGGGGSDGFSKMEMEQLLENSSFSPPALDHDQPGCGSEVTSQNGEDTEADADYRYTRPAYVPPSIMGHRKWVQVKAERPEQGEEEDDCGVLFCSDAPGQSTLLGRSQASASRSSLEDSLEDKLVAQLEEESLDEDRPYEDPLDFYGTTMEGFSTGKNDSAHTLSAHTLPGLKEDLSEGAGGGGETGEEGGADGGGERSSGGGRGHQEETSHSGFASVVYKLYPCQCGKSFTHKSQRDRHMSMHLGLRPYGCAVCGKSFKMKHHLVGHMKIHTGVKPYECSLCSKRFMWRDSFNRHTSSCSKAQQQASQAGRRAGGDTAGPGAQTC